MADDVEFGHVVELTLGETDGTALTADAAVSATTLSVEYAGDFDPDGGSLMLNGAMLEYEWIAEGATEGDPDVITLTDPLAVAATADDRVGLVAGGQPVELWQIHVDLGDGDPADIDIPWEQRAMWSAVDVSTPVPVVVSADLERIVEVPGRAPVMDSTTIDSTSQSYITTRLYGSTDTQSIADSTWTNLGVSGSWFTVPTPENPDFTFNDVAGTAEIEVAGWYVIDAQVRWASNGTGNRQVRVAHYGLTRMVPVTFDYVEMARQSVGPQSGQIGIHLHQLVHLLSGDSISVQCWQNSGGSLNVIGTATDPGALKLEFPTYWTIRRAV